jgi:hypothetical protein
MVRMLEAAAAQKPEELPATALRSRDTRENRTANGRKRRPIVKMPRTAKRHPKSPDITPALDRVR